MAEVTHPWSGEPWSEAADAANEGLNGQGYIVHVAMLASRKADELGWWVI
jgi:hypothetical protein